ncbi:hypothetical protein, partial [Kribbella turkmenica]|uniref:hypothetical protein n=1 Tax=Kribbella turkmenica TaxID=2530375 RepID=UPI001404DC7E
PMPDRLTKWGTVAYVLVAAVIAVQAVLLLQGKKADVHGWVLWSLLAVVLLSGVLIAAGALSRRGLIAEDGPWIFRYGWIVLVGLTVVNVVVDLVASGISGGSVAWATGPAVFLPHFVRRLEESYYDGVAEAEEELRAARGGGFPPGS